MLFRSDPRYPALVRRWLEGSESSLKAAAARRVAAGRLVELTVALRPLLLAPEPEVRCAGAAALLALHGS